MYTLYLFDFRKFLKNCDSRFLARLILRSAQLSGKLCKLLHLGKSGKNSEMIYHTRRININPFKSNGISHSYKLVEYL